MKIGDVLRTLIPARFRPIGYLTRLVQRRTSQTVISGPFRGVRYVSYSVGSAYIPKLLGLYEKELHGVIDAMIEASPDLIVDIGAAEGYYAVGIAVRCKGTKVVAFEENIDGRNALSLMSSLNDCADRISIRGRCEPVDLTQVLDEVIDPTIICDTEGYEGILLDPALVPKLENARILVETHDFMVPGVTDDLCARFAATHECHIIRQQPRAGREFPFSTVYTRLLEVLPPRYLDWAVSEWRPVPMTWLWLLPMKRSHAR